MRQETLIWRMLNGTCIVVVDHAVVMVQNTLQTTMPQLGRLKAKNSFLTQTDYLCNQTLPTPQSTPTSKNPLPPFLALPKL